MSVFARRVRSAVKVGARSSVAFAAFVGAGVAAPGGAAQAIGGDVDLSVGAGIEVDPATNSFLVGDEVLFGFELRNDGPDVATDVVVSVSLPPQVQIVRWHDGPADGRSCVVGLSSATCTWPTLPVGVTQAIGDLRAAAPTDPFFLELTVTTTANEVDPADDVVPGFPVRAAFPAADLQVFVSPPGDATVGQTSILDVGVWNTGPHAANEVVFATSVPDAFVVDDIVVAGGIAPDDLSPTCTITGQRVECSVGRVEPGTPVAARGAFVRLAVTPALVGSGSVTATVTSSVADPDPADNEASMPFVVLARMSISPSPSRRSSLSRAPCLRSSASSSRPSSPTPALVPPTGSSSRSKVRSR